jgi:hypothetical protein
MDELMSSFKTRDGILEVLCTLMDLAKGVATVPKGFWSKSRQRELDEDGSVVF